MGRRVFIETYGCQMNEADSELMYGLLRKQGFEVADDAEQADVVLLNTCAVREKAEDRIFGRLGWLKSAKAKNPNLVLGVTGCMAERMRDGIVERAPHVDLVIGPDAYRRLPEMVAQQLHEDGETDPAIDVRLDKRELYTDVPLDRVPGISGWITVQRGCDKFCTFCIVPFVRGRERSLPPDEVVAQAQEMAEQGFKEVTLLGQTVSSYYERGFDFADLLTRVHAVEGLSRIRFTSPYPNDFSDRLLERLAGLPRIGKHLHLPVQSGSTRILKDMRRGYTAEAFQDLIGRVRRILPGWAITTDIIVGYPGETEADFQETMDLVGQVRFDGAFMFHYSEREGTRAARTRPDDIPLEVKKDRLKRLIDQQETLSKASNAAMVGREVEVLVQGRGKRNPNQLIGRSSCFRTTVLPADEHTAAGDLVRARVSGATSHTLFAEPIAR
ncbi:MAG: tRNA (N6-isopentenyl adenosine(37)-C2)-methylthiotransferase MiaB [Myxococcales bacterium]|nr:tRNA (N6-isopentenyl adenosine(37)-C2)-methylthiotransferase MiaB [Myxococcales bacterium]MCB9522237.1 tRNA (N6-isopentenyl adenosine(37)-C2)-methylthiotransferase MiaB [Myxococcales bacterium]